MERGSQRCWSGCFAVPLGSRHLLLSASPLDSKGDEQSQEGEAGGNPGVPSVANLPVVPAGGEDDGIAPLPPAHIQAGPDPSGSGQDPGLPGPSRGSTYFRESLARTCVADGLDQDDIQFLSEHLAPGSSSGYGYTWHKFSSFCQEKGVDPFTAPVSIIIKYLRKIFNDGAAYRTINYARSAISKLHIGFGDMPIGQHPLIKQTVRAVFRLRPPLPRYKSTFDIRPALTYMKQILGNNSILNLKLLSYKCLFLIAFHSFSRVSTVCKLGAGIEEHQDFLIVPLLSTEKQARGVQIIFITFLITSHYS